MKSLNEVMRAKSVVPMPNELEANSIDDYDNNKIPDEFPETDSLSKEGIQKDEDISIYGKTDGDSRYVVRVGKLLALSIGSPAEGYGLKRISVWSPQLESEVFNEEQVAKGNLELIAEAPEEVTSTINRTLSTLNQIVDALGEFVY
jgi:hypothetical protein